MGTKKSLGKLEDGIHMTRLAQISCPASSQRSKKRRTEPPTLKKQVHASSVHAVKKRIRDVKRRLERCQNLPATVRVGDERALAVYQQELAAALEEKTKQKMIKKYHMVRFFERQKATRQLRRLRKLLLEAESTDEVEKIKAQMQAAEVDLNYTQHFPLNERYVSLYPAKPADTDQGLNQAEAKKPAMWAVVEKSMENGTLDQLRNRKRVDVKSQKPLSTSTPVSAPSTTKTQPNGSRSQADVKSSVKRKTKFNKVNVLDNEPQFAVHGRTTKDDEGHESDLGFFEE